MPPVPLWSNSFFESKNINTPNRIPTYTQRYIPPYHAALLNSRRIDIQRLVMQDIRFINHVLFLTYQQFSTHRNIVSVLDTALFLTDYIKSKPYTENIDFIIMSQLSNSTDLKEDTDIVSVVQCHLISSMVMFVVGMIFVNQDDIYGNFLKGIKDHFTEVLYNYTTYIQEMDSTTRSRYLKRIKLSVRDRLRIPQVAPWSVSRIADTFDMLM